MIVVLASTYSLLDCPSYTPSHPHTSHTLTYTLTHSHTPSHTLTQVVWSLSLLADQPALVKWVVGTPAPLFRDSSDPLPSLWIVLYRTLSGVGRGGGEGRRGRVIQEKREAWSSDSMML